jgi:hypothetical protein
MIATSLSLLLLWWYASYREKLVGEEVDAVIRKHLLLNYISMAGIFALSTGVAFLHPQGSQYIYFLLIPNSMLLERIKRRELRRPAEENRTISI